MPLSKLRSVMVHLDPSDRTSVRLAMAISLAHDQRARLIGVFGQRASAQRVGVVATWPSAEYKRAAEESREAFGAAVGDMPDAKWLDINRGSDAEILRQITDLARYSDLTLLGQNGEAGRMHAPPDLAEEVVVNSGRPILVIPYAGEFPRIAKHPLIAWNNSRESAHAVNDSLPLIAGCEEATIISLAPRYQEADNSCAQLAAYLACHGIRANTEVLVVDDVGVMDMLLSRVSDVGADLLVMGAHASAGLPFVSGGAGTRHVLRHMVVPVLMSN